MRHLDHVDAEERRVDILPGSSAEQSASSSGERTALGAGTIDVQVDPDRSDRRTSVCVCDPRQVCTAATCRGLRGIADVEDADAAKPLGAHRRLDALRAAVDPASRLLHRHEQQVAVHRHIALSAGTHDRGNQPRPARVLDVVGVEPVVVADERRDFRWNARSELREVQVDERRAACRALVGGVALGPGRSRAPPASARRPAPSDRRSPPAWACSRRAPCCGPPARRHAIPP